MRAYTLKHVSDRDLLRDLAALVAQDRTTTASLLAHIAEVDSRRLYRPAAYPSMRAYCVHELRLSEDAASKRIQAARKAREFPAIFSAVADGRLHLTAVGLLAPHLNPENADELLATAAHKTKAEIELLLAQRFPQSEMLALVQPLPGTRTTPEDPHVLAHAGGCTDEHALAHVEVAAPRSKVKPHAPGRFALHLTMSQATYDKLQYAQSLLSHAIPSGDVAEVLDRALDALIVKLEKRKFAATDRPQTGFRRSAVGKRHVPAHVKRAVRERDQDQCTFVSETGRRCSARELLEYDHVDPVARGGQATVVNMQLRCRAHNQFGAECTFGAGFMNAKREAARRVTAAARARAAEAHARVAAAEQAKAAEAEAHARAAAAEQTRDVVACLRTLGCRVDEARRVVDSCTPTPDATLEERVRAALKFLGPKPRFHGRVGTIIGGADAMSMLPPKP